MTSRRSFLAALSALCVPWKVKEKEIPTTAMEIILKSQWYTLTPSPRATRATLWAGGSGIPQRKIATWDGTKWIKVS
jgi:hypothetical protein